MGLCPMHDIRRLQFVSLDQYLRQMHSDILAQVLRSFCDFAERVMPKVQRSPDATMWNVAGPIVIDHVQLTKLSAHVDNLLRLVGFEDDCVATSEPCPGFAMLKKEATRASLLFREFKRCSEAGDP